MASAIDITFPGNIAQVASIADLRDIPSPFLLGTTVYLLSGYGLYFFDPASLVADNGTTVIKPDDLTPLQAGRWVLAGSTFFDSGLRTALSTSTGAGLVGVIQSGTGAVAETLQAAYRRGFVFPQQFTNATLGTGANDSAAIQSALDAAAGRVVILPYVSGGYKVNTPLTVPANTTLIGQGMVRLYSTAAGQHILSGSGAGSVTIQGISFDGAGWATVPVLNPSGYGVDTTGLVTLFNCTDVRVTDCAFSNFYNGVSTLKCTRVWVERNRVRNFMLYGTLGSYCQQYTVRGNVITDCQQTGGFVAYGVMATGDEAGGNPLISFLVEGNYIKGIPSWDGVMSHDGREIIVRGNVIDDVRTGIDVGHFSATNLIRRVVIEGNSVHSTTTNTWGATAASIAGISVSGYDAANIVTSAVIADNVVSDFFNAAMTAGGNSSNIVIVHTANVACTGNVVSGAGSTVSNAGIYVLGKADYINISANTLRGVMISGGIRFANVSSESPFVGGNSIVLNSTGVEAFYISGSTLTNACFTANATNSALAYSTSASTITYSAAVPYGSFTGALTGVTGTITGTVKYSINGDLVSLEFPDITGTSNTTSATITGLPTELQPKNDQYCFGFTTNNTVDGAARIQVAAAGTIILQVGTSVTFANTGTKGIKAGTITYRRN